MCVGASEVGEHWKVLGSSPAHNIVGNLNNEVALRRHWRAHRPNWIMVACLACYWLDNLRASPSNNLVGEWLIPLQGRFDREALESRPSMQV